MYLARAGHRTIAVYAGLVVPRPGLERFGSLVSIDFAYAGSRHRVVLGRTFLDSDIMVCEGPRG